jgi:hypothetical protein
MQSDAMFVDPMAAKYGAQSDGYPSVHDGLSLVKSDACESGYKGVSISRAAGSITIYVLISNGLTLILNTPNDLAKKWYWWES